MQRMLALAYCATALYGCALNDSIITGEIGGDENFEYFIEGDMAVAVPHSEGVFLASGGTGPDAIFLNFAGLTIHKDGWRQDNAQSDSSFITDADRVIPAFDAQYWPGSRASVIAEIVQGVRDDFAAYDVLVTDTRPASGSYTMIVIGGRPSDIGRTGSLLGVAPFDSSNWNPNDVGFVFSDRAGDNGYLPRYLSHVISHELGHTVGLNHVVRNGEIMRSSACHCAQTWGTGPIAGNTSLFQDDDALLAAAFPGRSPIGRINSINAQGHLRGWACDPDDPSASIDVELSIGGIAGSGAPGLSLLADRASGTPVATLCGGGNAHRFEADLSLDEHCGKVVHAYGHNYPGTAGSTTQLEASPKSMPACPTVVNPDPDPVPPEPVVPDWIGSSCTGTNSCDLSHGGVTSSECLSWFDADVNTLYGFCSNDCAGSCVNLPGEAPSFCTSVQGAGQCVAVAGPLNSNCADIAGTKGRAKPRHVGTSGGAVTWETVCLPAQDAITCSVSGAAGECIDTGASTCGGTLYTGKCPGPNAIRCCVP